jgi:AcrR family transcriptional regulator
VLFWNKGYDRTSIREIAHACGFEQGNIYNYFPSKEQLLFEALREEMDRLLSTVKRLVSNSSASATERLRLVIYHHVDYTLGNRLGSRLLFDAEIRHLSPRHRGEVIELRDTYDNILRAIILDGRNTGEFRDIDEMLVGFCIASMIVRSRIWFSPRGRLSPSEVAKLMFEFILDGVAGEKRLLGFKQQE